MSAAGEGTRFEAARLDRLIRQSLLVRGLSEEHAGFVAEGLVEASLRGVDTHGVRLFRTYLSELDGGRARARPEIRVAAGASAARLLDADAALGLVAGRVAAAEAMELARVHGVGVVVVRNSNHFGPAGYYTQVMARQGFLGFCCTNSDALVAPFHGTAPLYGTNPLSLSALAEEDDLFSLDMATSQVAYSRVRHARNVGKPLAPGWAVDGDGQDVAEAGGEVAALSPLGGYKGQGLGLMVEVLSALLAGEPLDHELTHLFDPPFDAPRRVAHFFLAIEIGTFSDPARFRQRLKGLMAATRAQRPMAGEEVLAPGDPEARTARERTRTGIPLTSDEESFFRELEARLAPA